MGFSNHVIESTMKSWKYEIVRISAGGHFHIWQQCTLTLQCTTHAVSHCTAVHNIAFILYATLHCIILHRSVMWCCVLCNSVMQCISTVQYSTLFSPFLYCLALLLCIVLHYIVLSWAKLDFAVLKCITLQSL